MSQTQTSTTLRNTSFHSGVMSTGLAIHEREREEERKRRRAKAKIERQLSDSPSVGLPLFAEPRKVQPSSEDVLQQQIKATLPEFESIAPVLQHHNHLIGIMRLPQTPVDKEPKAMFKFDTKRKDTKNHADLKNAKLAVAKIQASAKSGSKSKEQLHVKFNSHDKKVNGIVNGTGHSSGSSVHATTKIPEASAVVKNSTLSHAKSPSVPEITVSKSAETKKLDIKPVVNGQMKSLHSGAKEREKEKEKEKEKGTKENLKGHSEGKKKENSHEKASKQSVTNKSKPPKLSMPERNLPLTSAEDNQFAKEPTNVEDIVAEMQKVAPPLTGIHTPIKGGPSIFAFNRNGIQQEPGLAIKRKMSENPEERTDGSNELLDDDLKLSDDEDGDDDEHGHHTTLPSKPNRNGRIRSHSSSSSDSSSGDSDSDSSDSDSESSGSDTNNNTKNKANSPVRSPPSSPKPASGRNWGLGDLEKALCSVPTALTTKTKPSPSSSNTVGGEGLRGNQAAPAPNANIKSSLNSHVSNGVCSVGNDVKSPPSESSSLAPFAAELLSPSPEENHGVDIESITAKLDPPVASEAVVETPKPPLCSELEQNDLTVKVPLPKGSEKKEAKKRVSTAGSKLNSSGLEKRQAEKTPKKSTKLKKETSAVKSTLSLKNENASKALKDEHASKALKDEHSSKTLKDEHSSKALKEEHSSKALKEDHARKALKDEHSSKALKEEHSSKALKDEHASKALKDEHASKALKDEHASKALKDEHASKALKDEHASKALKDEHASKAGKPAHSDNKESTGKKLNKNKVDSKSVGDNATEKEAVKPVNQADDEDIIVDIVGDDRTPPLDSAKSDNKPTPATKSKEPEKTKLLKSKPAKLTNGLSSHINGEKLLSSLVSPNRTKEILSNDVEITLHDDNKRESLIVKIDLSLLKRIPKIPGSEPVHIKFPASSPLTETNGSWDAVSPSRVKIHKRPSSGEKSVDQEASKKVKLENSKDSSQKRPRERTNSGSSSGNRHTKDTHRKRSPSQENDCYRNKRRREDSECSKGHEPCDRTVNHDKSITLENGVTATDGAPQSKQCSCDGQNTSEKRDSFIATFYEPLPRVPHGPDHYLAEAKKLKHKGDSLNDKEAKAFLYIGSVLHFARCGKALEQNEESESHSAHRMYSETLDLLRYTMRSFVSRVTHADGGVDRRLAALCMRLQSILYMRLYKLRKEHVMKNVKTVTEHFRGPPKSTQAPSPYTSNAKMTGTPSPLSPTPSPSGSVGSVGSVGSTGSNEAVTTPSRNGKTSAMTSPVNVCIPQKIHSLTAQHVLQANNLLYSIDLWDQAQAIVLEYKDFFMAVDRICGPLTLHSSIVHMIEYVEQGVKLIREKSKADKSSS